MREFLGCSANIPEVILLKQLTVAKALSYLSKMGVDVSAESDVGLSLALGGMTNGMTPVEMAGAYATIANGGVYRTPLYYTKVVDNTGKPILEPKQEETRVFSEQNAWILQDLLKEPIYGPEATGSAARISGQELRGKTGTTNDNSSASFVGFTKYYTASVCMFFDREADGNNKTNATSGTCARLYQAIMSKVHTGLPAKGWDRPSGITTAVVCKSSGLLAKDECHHDPEGNKAYTEYFAQGNVPSAYCSTHVTAEICNKTGKLAGEKCTDKTSKVFITRKDAETDTRWRSAWDAKYMLPTEKCEVCTVPSDPIDNVQEPNGNGNNITNNTTNTNTTNSSNTTNTVKNTTTNTANTSKNNTVSQ